MSVRNNLLKVVDATVGALMCQILQFSSRVVNHDGTYPKLNPAEVKRILLIRPGGLGDMVVLCPVIKRLKTTFPNAEIDIVCERRNIEVLRIAGFDGMSLVYDQNPFGFIRQLMSRKYDVAIDTEQFHHFSAVFAFISGAPLRVGFKINPRRNPLYTHLVNYSLEGYEGEQFMALAGALTGDNGDYALKDCFDGTGLPQEPAVSSKLSAAGKYAVVHAGASSRYKLWTTGKYIELVSRLLGERGLSVVLAGDADDSQKCLDILEGVPKGNDTKCLSVAGELNLSEVASVINAANLYVGVDSGLAHMAVALGVPTVVLFGPSDERKWGLDEGRHAVVRDDLPCAPCFMFGYNKPCKTIACMQRIGSDEVLKAVGKVLGA